MSRKGVGLAAFDRSRITSAQYASHGSSLRTSDAAALETQLAVFRSLLQQFAQTHAKDIRSNPSFRAQFARMCAAIGVDPLAASSTRDGGGSIWAQLLGRSVNDFYFELAVKVVEVCSDTREENGGLIEVRKVRESLMQSRMEGAPDITECVSPAPAPTAEAYADCLSLGMISCVQSALLSPWARHIRSSRLAANRTFDLFPRSSTQTRAPSWRPYKCLAMSAFLCLRST
jgi:hypothetical protein